MNAKRLAVMAFLCAIPAAQAAVVGGGWSSSTVYDHSKDYENKSFALGVPSTGKCLAFSVIHTPGSAEVDATLGDCGYSLEQGHFAYYSRFVYFNGQLEMVDGKTTNRRKCMHVLSAAEGAKVVFRACNGSQNQKFVLENNLSGLESRFRVRSALSSQLCLSAARPATMRRCDKNSAPQTLEMILKQDPVSVTVANRGWYVTSLSIHNDFGGYYPAQAIGLNDVRHQLVPIIGIPETIRVQDDGDRQVIIDARPGDAYEVSAHGTSFNKSLKLKTEQRTAYVELFAGANYTYGGLLDSLRITTDQPNLYDFNLRAASFKIPSGWTVRFFEGANYTGKYYTRTGNNTGDSHIKGKIRSIKILSTNKPKFELYSYVDFGGDKLEFSEDVMNLYEHNDRIVSYKIPEGMTIRFFEGPNHTGRYYTRTGSKNSDSSIMGNVQSVKIL